MYKKYMFLLVLLLLLITLKFALNNRNEFTDNDADFFYYVTPISSITVLNGHTGEQSTIANSSDILLLSENILNIPFVAVDVESIKVDGFAYHISIEGETTMYFSSYKRVNIDMKSYAFAKEEDFEMIIEKIISLIE